MTTFRDLHDYIRKADRDNAGMHYPVRDVNDVAFHIYNGYTQVNIIVDGTTRRNIIFRSDDTVSIAIVTNEIAQYDRMHRYDIDTPIDDAGNVLGQVVRRILYQVLEEVSIVDATIEVLEEIYADVEKMNHKADVFDAFRDGYRKASVCNTYPGLEKRITVDAECEERIKQMAEEIIALAESIDNRLNECGELSSSIHYRTSFLKNNAEAELVRVHKSLDFINQYYESYMLTGH